MSDVDIKDLFLFFWPPLVICAAIGAIASGNNRRVIGSVIGVAGGLVVGFVLMLIGPAPGRP